MGSFEQELAAAVILSGLGYVIGTIVALLLFGRK